jgi:hypothetical protein
MADPRFEYRRGSPVGYYGQWCDPFFEDDGGALIAVALIFIILGGFLIYGSAHFV